MNPNQLFLSASVAAIASLVVANPAEAFVFTQSQIERESNREKPYLVTDPFEFTFSDLASVAPGTEGFTLDLKFRALDLDGTGVFDPIFFDEYLLTTVTSNGNSYDLGKFDFTVKRVDEDPQCGRRLADAIFCPEVGDAYGHGSMFVDFDDIGGDFFSDPFVVTLTPSNGVQPYGTFDVPDKFDKYKRGRAKLTLSYEAVPTPAAVLPVISGLFAAARRRKNEETEEV